MGFFDSVRDTSGAVFSMDQLKGADDFGLCVTARGALRTHTLAPPIKKTGSAFSIWRWTGHPLISRKHPSGGSNRSDRLRPALHLWQRIATVSQQEGHSRPQDEQPRACLPRHQGSRLRTRKLRSTPMTSYRPRTEHESHTSDTRTSHKQGHKMDAPQSGLYYQGKRGYNFQGWNGEGEGLFEGLSVGERETVPRVALRRRKE